MLLSTETGHFSMVRLVFLAGLESRCLSNEPRALHMADLVTELNGMTFLSLSDYQGIS